MKEKLITNIGALFSAVLASMCCIGPLILAGFGLGGVGMWKRFEEYRPVFMAVTILLIGTAFYFTYRKPKVVCEDPCCTPKSNRFNKVMLWVVTIFAAGFMAFPYFSSAFVSGARDSSNISSKTSVEMVIKVEGMTCSGCEAHIEKAARSVPGVINAKADYKNKEARIAWETTPDKASIQELIKAIADAGYKASLPK